MEHKTERSGLYELMPIDDRQRSARKAGADIRSTESGILRIHSNNCNFDLKL